MHRQLHLGEPALQRPDFLHQSATLLVERANIVRHLFQLFYACLVVIAVDIDGLQHFVEMVDDRVQTSAKRPSARRAFTIFADGDYSIALVLELGVLLA